VKHERLVRRAERRRARREAAREARRAAREERRRRRAEEAAAKAKADAEEAKRIDRLRKAAEDREHAAAEAKKKLGMSVSVNPPDGDWLTLFRRVDGENLVHARLLVSIEVLPAAVCASRKNGMGRQAPNEFPELPPPEGRLHLSLKMFNPLVIFKMLCGAACGKLMGPALCVVVLVLGFIASIYLSGPFGALMSSITAMQMLLPAAVFNLAMTCVGIAVCAGCVGCCWCVHRCRASHKAMEADEAAVQAHEDAQAQ
jgi:hypothetical protein